MTTGRMTKATGVRIIGNKNKQEDFTTPLHVIIGLREKNLALLKSDLVLFSQIVLNLYHVLIKPTFVKNVDTGIMHTSLLTNVF